MIIDEEEEEIDLSAVMAVMEDRSIDRNVVCCDRRMYESIVRKS